MRNDDWLAHNTAILRQAGIESARLDCLILLEDTMSKNRAWILAHPEFELSTAQAEVLHTQIVQRSKHVPLAYIRGHVEFYGRNFIVNQHVLVPRPESETIITMLTKLVSNTMPEATTLSIIDLGTGSGALAVSAALELPKASVIGTDIDIQCLDVARHNAQLLNADCTFVKVDLLDADALAAITDIYSNPYIILANLPYVPDKYPINQAAKHEPGLALFAGSDGLELYRVLFDQISSTKIPPYAVLTECLSEQHTELAAIATSSGMQIAGEEDLIQLFIPRL